MEWLFHLPVFLMALVVLAVFAVAAALIHALVATLAAQGRTAAGTVGSADA